MRTERGILRQEEPANQSPEAWAARKQHSFSTKTRPISVDLYSSQAKRTVSANLIEIYISGHVRGAQRKKPKQTTPFPQLQQLSCLAYFTYTALMTLSRCSTAHEKQHTSTWCYYIHRSDSRVISLTPWFFPILARRYERRRRMTAEQISRREQIGTGWTHCLQLLG